MFSLLQPLHVTLLVAGAIATLIGAVLAWPHRRAPAGPVLLLLLLAIAEWQLAGAAVVAAETLGDKRWWAQVQYVGIAAVPPLWFHFVLRHLGVPRAGDRALQLATALLPAALVVAAATSERHRLLWTSVELVPMLDGARAVFHHGPLFWAGSAFSYLLLAWAGVLLWRRAPATTPAAAAQRRVLLIGGGAPWLANALYLWGPATGMDLTPVAFGITGICAVIALADLGLLAMSPAGLWRSGRH